MSSQQFRRSLLSLRNHTVFSLLVQMNSRVLFSERLRARDLVSHRYSGYNSDPIDADGRIPCAPLLFRRSDQ